MRIALYARTSTDDQHPEAQLEPLRRTAVARGGSSVREYVDIGVSGRRTSRPALDRLLADCRAKGVDVLVISALDRLGRRSAALAAVIEDLEEWGVQLVSLREGVDTSTPMGRAMAGMAGVFAQLEADLIRERTVAGLAAAVNRGKVLGRPRALTPTQVHEAEIMVRKGVRLRAVAKALGVGYSTVRRALAA